MAVVLPTPPRSRMLSFQVLGQLGTGGMGRVDLAKRVDDQSGTLIAVKRLHQHLAEDPAFLEMFVNEVRVTAAVSHPNVVALIGWGRDDDGIFLATELVRGASLADLIKAGGISPPLAAYVCARVAAGLHAAHTATGP
jgi:serine/threonine-protein kinase